MWELSRLGRGRMMCRGRWGREILGGELLWGGRALFGLVLVVEGRGEGFYVCIDRKRMRGVERVEIWTDAL